MERRRRSGLRPARRSIVARRPRPATLQTRSPAMLAHSQVRGADSPVSTIMTRDFEVVRDDLDVDRLAKRLLAQRVSCAAVSDAGGNLIGFVSMIDLVRDRYLNGETET